MTKYFPTPSDRMGFLWTLTSIEDCYVIEFGPAGTTHFAIEGVMELGADHKMNVFTTHMTEVDITFGKHDKLAGAINEIDNIHQPKYIFVMASSVSALIGIDIESICFEMAGDVQATLIPVTYGGYDGDYNLGIERAMLALCKAMVQPAEPDPTLYNIIGSNIDSYNFLSDKNEIALMLDKTFGARLNTCFTAYTSIEEIENAGKAGFNIVLRKEGVAAAEWLKKTFGTPFIYAKPYGLSGTLEWIKAVAELSKLPLNFDYIKSQTEQVKSYVSNYKMYLRNKTNKRVLISGDYDTATGFAELLSTLGLEPDSTIITHSLSPAHDNLIVKPSDSELKSLTNKGYYVLFGDDNVRLIYQDCAADVSNFFQISNPNMEQYNFYPQTPFVGFNGTLRVLQDLMNYERALSRKISEKSNAI